MNTPISGLSYGSTQAPGQSIGQALDHTKVPDAGSVAASDIDG